MPYNKASSRLDPHLAGINSKIIKSGLTTSLIAGIFSLPSLNLAQATTSTKEMGASDRTSIKNNLKAENKSKAATLSPHTFNPVASIKTLVANLSSRPSLKNEHLPNASVSNLTDTKPSLTSIESEIASLNRVPLASSVNSGSSTTLLAATQSQFHIVGRGDTISKIAKKYGVSKEDLVRLNQIKNSNVIFVRQKLEIPTAKTVSTKSDRSKNSIQQPATQATSIPVEAATNSLQNSQATLGEDSHIAKLRANIEQLRASDREQSQRISSLDRDFQSDTAIKNVKPTSTEASVVTSAISTIDSNSIPQEALALQLPPLPPSDEYLPSAFEGYIWPAQGVLTSGYGWRWGRMHRGIDIAAPIGTPIVAAASGKVINAGWQSGYGNLIKMEHLDGSVTIYAHNHKNLVSHGQKVDQGEQIAEMGNTGRSTGSHLHFEIHSPDKAAINPLTLLASRK